MTKADSHSNVGVLECEREGMGLDIGKGRGRDTYTKRIRFSWKSKVGQTSTTYPYMSICIPTQYLIFTVLCITDNNYPSSSPPPHYSVHVSHKPTLPPSPHSLTLLYTVTHCARNGSTINEFRRYEAKIEESEKAGSYRELNPRHLWLEPPVLCH